MKAPASPYNSPAMNIRVQAGQLVSVEAGAIVVNLFQGVTEPGGATGILKATASCCETGNLPAYR